MTERTITLTEARRILRNLAEQPLEEVLIITSHDQPLFTLMPYRAHRDLLANVESLQTVLEIMLGGVASEHTRSPRPAKPVLVTDKSISWEEFKEEVGWE
ncbi:MAG TPA: hypothetical protein VHD63_07895 [Ktedonobacteraceae bacterium]|nr:hypothetical protein [Ktedonobacteraceae bacterium]